MRSGCINLYLGQTHYIGGIGYSWLHISKDTTSAYHLHTSSAVVDSLYGNYRWLSFPLAARIIVISDRGGELRRLISLSYSHYLFCVIKVLFWYLYINLYRSAFRYAIGCCVQHPINLVLINLQDHISVFYINFVLLFL